MDIFVSPILTFSTASFTILVYVKEYLFLAKTNPGQFLTQIFEICKYKIAICFIRVHVMYLVAFCLTLYLQKITDVNMTRI